MDDGENINRKPKHLRHSAFTLYEKILVVQLVNLHYDVLSIKVMNAVTINQKREAWKAIHRAYLENNKFVRRPRTLRQLQKCWYNIKCNAKKGEPEAVKLMQIIVQNNLENQKTYTDKDIVYGSTISQNSVAEDSDAAPTPEFLDLEPKDKPEENQNSSEQSVDENFLRAKEGLNNTECTHCERDENEIKAQVQTIALQKQLKIELLTLEVLLLKERLENERELHNLHVQEVSLKIENERKRAEILNKEIENDSSYSKKTYLLTSYQTYSTD